MKKIVFVLLLILFLLPGVVFAQSICSQKLESLPVQSQGRVMPLGVHAKEVLRFLTGKSKPTEKNSVVLYCDLSFSKIFPDSMNKDEILLKVEHVKTKRFLGVDENVKGVSLERVLDKYSETVSYLTQMQKQKAVPKAHLTDLQMLLKRAQIYVDVLSGKDWTVFQNKEWLPLKDFVAREGLTARDFTLKKITALGQEYTKKDSRPLIELRYHDLHLIYWAILIGLMALIFSFVFKKHNHPLPIIGVGLVLAIEIAVMIFRVLISKRAPVTNMYETVMWVGFGSLLFALILGVVRKERLFIIFGLVLNLLCLFMMSFATTMLDSSIKPLVPVLRDNFWLATHVTSITISYAALGLSWFVANYYMIKFMVKKVSDDELKRLNVLCYDCLKIGVVLLAAGIILGGVWADYSWGRFWGWDPKETWSLIALLAYIAVLHGRFAGWIKVHSFLPFTGFAFNTVLMAWFGVNYILASGLHSYGFSSGGTMGLIALFVFQSALFISYFIKKKLVYKV